MFNVISNVAGRIQETVDPQYKKDKLEAKSTIQKEQEITMQFLAASVGLSILGNGLSNCGLSLIGIPLVMFNLPLGFFAYNANKMYVNMDDILENPKKYQAQDGLSQTYSADLLKEKLRKETVCFEWAIDGIVEIIVRSTKANPGSFGWVKDICSHTSKEV